MTPERIRDFQRLQLIAIFNERESRFRENLVTQNPETPSEQIDVEMKAFQSVLRDQLNLLLNGDLLELSQLAPQPIAPGKSDGRNLSGWEAASDMFLTHNDNRTHCDVLLLIAQHPVLPDLRIQLEFAEGTDFSELLDAQGTEDSVPDGIGSDGRIR
jgi:hypothetical protein